MTTYEHHQGQYWEEADSVEDEGVGEDVGGDEGLPGDRAGRSSLLCRHPAVISDLPHLLIICNKQI